MSEWGCTLINFFFLQKQAKPDLAGLQVEMEMATHSGILAWRIPGTAEPGGLPSMGLHRVRHD